MPDYIDIHAHANFESFNDDREAVIKHALDEKVWMINVGTDENTSKEVVELANKYEKGVFAIVGMHPVHAPKSDQGSENSDKEKEAFNVSLYHSLAQNSKVVGIGECGLDYFRVEPDSIKKQKENFEKQVILANEVGKPLMLHIRGNPKDNKSPYKDALEIIKSTAKVSGNVHFFAGTPEEAKLFLDFGFTLSFTGVITFARNYDEIIKNIPLNMLMSETDCPFVAPTPYRGKRNEPLYVKEVVKKIAEIRGEDFEKVRNQLVLNAVKTFRLM